VRKKNEPVRFRSHALPYLVGPFLCLRRKTFGYALTFASGVFWLWCGAILTTFVRNGFEQAEQLIRTGIIDRFDVLMAVPAGIGTAGLAIFSLIGYFKLPNKKATDEDYEDLRLI
jgi:hypothetical protein